jgi:hypothetical protein
MNPFTIIKEEHRSFPRNSCPVDLMGKIANEEKGPKVFFLNADAFLAMMFYPVGKSFGINGLTVSIIWDSSMETMTLKKLMNMT